MSTVGPAASATPRRTPGPTGSVLIALAVALAVLLVRGSGPSDLWDQVQPRTIAYTVDLLEHGDDPGRWFLPREHAETPATKPPLYNWLAAPFVRGFGPERELGHRMPSVLAFLAAAGVLAAWASRRETRERALVVAIAFPLTYLQAKLGWLARPDQLVVLGALVAWIGIAEAVAPPAAPDARRRAVRRGPWLVVLGGGFASLAKGPAIAPMLVCAPLAAVLLAEPGERRVLARRMSVAAALAGLPWLAWLAAATLVDPAHVREVLLGDELAGRIAGTNPDAAPGGAGRIATSLPWMPFYLLVRFLPWSVPAIGAAVWCWWPGRDGDRRHRAAALAIGLFLVLFSLSAGKRADYLAPVAPLVALLAAAAIVPPPRPGKPSHPWSLALAVMLAAGALVGIAVDDRLDDQAPVPDLGRRLAQIAAEVRAVAATEPVPPVLLFAGTRDEPVAALLGRSVPPGSAPPADLARWRAGAAILLVERRAIAPDPPQDGGSQPTTADDVERAVRAAVPDPPPSRTLLVVPLDRADGSPWAVYAVHRIAPPPGASSGAMPDRAHGAALGAG